MTTLLLTGSSSTSSYHSPSSGNTSSGYATASVSSYRSYKSNRPPAAKGLMKEVNFP